MKKINKLIIAIVILIIIGIIAVFGINQYVKSIASKNIIQEVENANKSDAILVLGCQVMEDGSLSLMLKDRLDKAIELYKQGIAEKIIVSGDHGRAYIELITYSK